MLTALAAAAFTAITLESFDEARGQEKTRQRPTPSASLKRSQLASRAQVVHGLTTGAGM
jgi:hypothetical protein